MRMWKQIAIVAVMVVSYAACSNEPLAPPSIEFPATNVSFNAHVKPLFLSNCALSGCHDGYSENPQNPGQIIFRLESHGDVIKYGLVVAFDPERSSLAMVLRGTLLHPNSVYLTALNDNQRDGIVQWIREGASNN